MKVNWVDEAKCKNVDTNVFFPKRGDGINPLAVQTCEGCPVIEPCLEDALEMNIQVGYQGGMTAKKRRELLSIRHRQRIAS